MNYPTIGAGRLHHLDGLRGVAALVVVFNHFIVAFDFALYTGNPLNSRGAWDLWLASSPFDAALPGNLSCCLFFALSGHVLAGSFGRTSLGFPALIVKRYVRLGLPIFSVVMLAWLLHSTGETRNQTVALLTHSSWLSSQMLGSLTIGRAVTEGVYNSLVNGSWFFDSSLWTMSVEFTGSVFLILIFAGCQIVRLAKLRRRCQCVILLLFAVANYNSYLCLFGIGAFMAAFDIRRHTRPFCDEFWGATSLIVIGLMLGTVSYSLGRPQFLTRFLHMIPLSIFGSPEAFWHAIGSILLLAAIDGSTPLRCLFSGKALQLLGRISFPLYLVHVPILLSFGCGCYLLLLRSGTSEIAATIATFVAYVCVAITAAFALIPVESLAIRMSRALGDLVQAGVAWGYKAVMTCRGDYTPR